MHLKMTVRLIICCGLLTIGPGAPAQEKLPRVPAKLPKRLLEERREPPRIEVDLAKIKKDVSELQAAREALLREQQEARDLLSLKKPTSEAERLRLRLRVKALLLRLSENRGASTGIERTPQRTETGDSPETTKPNVAPRTDSTIVQSEPNAADDGVASPIDYAETLFRLGRHRAALKAFQQVALARLDKEGEVPIRYLMACCHRNLGQASEAEKEYRAIAEQSADGDFVQASQWHLSKMTWQRSVADDLQDLQRRMQALEK